MIFNLLIIHNHDRMSSISWILHTTTWNYFTSHLPHQFHHSPKVVKEVIMSEINDLVQDLEFWRTSKSSDGAVAVSFFAMCCLHEILQWCWKCVLFFIVVTVTAIDLADKNLQISEYSAQPE